MLNFFKKRRRKKLLETPAPATWRDVLERNIPHTSLLSASEWDELIRGARIIHAEKKFEGCGGLTLTEEMRVTISGWGSLLLLNRETDYYPHLETILVYPTQFVVPVQKSLGGDGGAQLREDEVRLGESLGEGGPGTIVLAWDEVMQCAGELSDGVNVAVHEFTHQLDEEDGSLNGTPLIQDAALRERWVGVFQNEYARLDRENAAYEKARGKKKPQEPLLDPYALTSTAEFFAVAMETFFEWPVDLEAEHPELYGVIRDYLGQDPAARWTAQG